MAKTKKASPQEAYPVEINLDDVQEIEPVSVFAAPAPQVSDQPYDIGQWKGIPQHRCKLCPFDTLDGEGAFWIHYAEAHTQPSPETPTSTIFIADRYGNEVK